MSVISHKFNQESPNAGKQVYVGTLDNWFLVKQSGHTLVYGYARNDKLGRFVDGEFIHTSYLCDFIYITELKTGAVTTRNSIYNLGAVKEGFNLEPFFKD